MRRLLAAAAEGALAGAALCAVEIWVRAGQAPTLAFPRHDLGAIALCGALAGVATALLPARVRPRSPFGAVLGAFLGLLLWFPSVTGGVLLEGSKLAKAAVTGVAAIVGGGFLGGWAASRVPHLTERARPVAADLALLALAAFAAFAPGSRRMSGSTSPNVLLLTIDTLRADRLGCYGHPQATTPHIDRLARHAETYAYAVTPQPRTLPGLASLATGVDPPWHGVRDNFHYTLGEESTTLAETLRDAGWATCAVNSNPVLSHDSGIFQGFDVANDRGDDWSRLTLARGVRRLTTLAAMRAVDRERVVTGLAIDWLRARPRSGPFFLWVHWLAPHVPYEPGPPFDRRFDPDYDGEYARAFDYGTVSKGEMTYRNTLSPRTLDHVIALYDGEVATSDRAVGELLRWMDASGELERTLVVLTADHGESLDEHGYFFNHGDFVYGPAVNVPLVSVDPSARQGRIEPDVVSLIDVAPAILARLGLRTDARPFGDGAPERLPGMRFGESDFCRFPDLNERLGYLLPAQVAQAVERIPDWKEKWEAQSNRAKQRFVIVEPWKLVLSPHPAGDRIELFDLGRDPGETIDLSTVRPEITLELESILRRWMDESQALQSSAGERILNEETIERMRALGYIGN